MSPSLPHSPVTSSSPTKLIARAPEQSLSSFFLQPNNLDNGPQTPTTKPQLLLVSSQIKSTKNKALKHTIHFPLLPSSVKPQAQITKSPQNSNLKPPKTTRHHRACTSTTTQTSKPPMNPIRVLNSDKTRTSNHGLHQQQPTILHLLRDSTNEQQQQLLDLSGSAKSGTGAPVHPPPSRG